MEIVLMLFKEHLSRLKAIYFKKRCSEPLVALKIGEMNQIKAICTANAPKFGVDKYSYYSYYFVISGLSDSIL